MCILRYGIAVDLDDLMDKKRLFYDIYDLKTESVPSEEEWALRMEETMSVFHQPQCMNPSEDESEREKLEEENKGSWADEVNIKVKSTLAPVEDIGTMHMDQLRGDYFQKLPSTKQELWF